jgi:formylglycine-generating enzyme required for sulfatase activity
MNQINEPSEMLPESSAARLAFYFAWIPLVGWMFYVAFAFLGLIQIGRGRLGFYRLRNGFIAVLFLSVLPIAGLVWWAELPQEYYVILNKFTKHGRVDTVNDGQLTQRKFFRFGKSFRLVKYSYYKNGQKHKEGNYASGKLIGMFTYCYDNGNPRMVETFVNNRRHGLTTWFDKSGKIERTTNYTDGISQEQIDAAKQAGVEPVIEVNLGDGVKMRMVFIPPGEFMMGSSPQEIAKISKEVGEDGYKKEGPQHQVTIKQGFYMCETEITQAQWKAMMYENPSYFKNGENYTPKDTANYPVENITWDNIKGFIQKLNNKGQGTFRLPSEAEWEYACRAETNTRFCFGDDSADLEDYAWYYPYANSALVTRNVANKKANHFGLYDMHGNVWEWCEDDYHDNYQKAPSNGSAWINYPRNELRVCRGGAFYFPPWGCRSASRKNGYQDERDNAKGGRLARSIK